MTKQKGKRAVIISNIKSETIEQAIFILKPPTAEQESASSPIVAEAQQIINSYIQTMERLHPECKKTNSGKRKLMVAGGAAAVVSAVLLLIFVL